MSGIIIQDDNRYFYTQKFLESKNICVKTFLHDKLKPSDLSINSKIKFILFELKKEPDKNIFSPKFFSQLDKNILIFSGVENKYLKFISRHNNLFYKPIMNSNYISILNSVPTAEGIIFYLIKNLNQTISKSNILIIGYGRCGKTLADKLKKLDANIFINTLKKSDYAIALTHKFKLVYDLNFDFMQKKIDAIINTAPTKTISDQILKAMPKNILLFDITNYGFDLNLAKEKNILSDRIFSIPSKFAPKTSGEIIGKYIFKKVKKFDAKK